MCIDLVFVKGTARGATPADVELVESFGQEGYVNLGHALFEQAEWQADGTGIEQVGEVTAEIVPSGSALTVRVRGGGDVSAYIRRATLAARRFGVVTIDVQEFAVLDA